MRSRLSYANVVATLALFLALCGGSYAALQLPRNSVGPKQLKKNSVTSVKVKAGSLLTSDFKSSQRKALVGPRGPQGAKGETGPTGAAGTMSGTLPSKATLRGVFNVDFIAAAAGQIGGGQISFPMRLPGAPTVQFLPEGAPATVSCPGSAMDPQAVPGYLCVYANVFQNSSSLAVCNQECVPSPSADREGALLYLHAAAAGRAFASGAWAVTAP